MGNTIWAKPDQPIQERIENSVLFGIKYLLNSWNYPRNCIWVDADAKTISCGQELVATVRVANGELKVDYSDDWGSWDIFVSDKALSDMIAKARAKLERGEGKSKGKGKPSSDH